jgi:putative RecB family exonuclease
MVDAELSPTPKNAYSFSRLKTFRQCPARYRMRYLQGLKEGFRSVEAYLGNTVHDALEWLYGERRDGREPTLDEALERLSARWRDGWSNDIAIIRVTDEAESYLRTGREMLELFVRDTFARDASETVSLEERLTMRLADDVVFTGFADRIGRTETGRLFVVDYKTSRSMGDGSEFSEGLQAPLYAACAMHFRDEESALAGYHYLRHGATRWREISSEAARQLFDRCLELVRLTEAAEEFPARPGVLCAWCGFNDRCPEAQVPEALSGGLRLLQNR